MKKTIKQTIVSAVLASTLLLGGQAMAANFNYQDNPFTLVYANAITKNEAGKVNIHPVKYRVNGITIAANVYPPPISTQIKNTQPSLWHTPMAA